MRIFMHHIFMDTLMSSCFKSILTNNLKIRVSSFSKIRGYVDSPRNLFGENQSPRFQIQKPLRKIEDETTNSKEQQYDPIYLEPQKIPKKQNINVCHIHFRSYIPGPMDFFVDFARRTAFHLSIPCSGTIYLPTQTTRWTVPRGPFVHKKSQENFERKTHKRLLTFKDANKNVIDRLLLYLTKNCPPGIGMRVTRWEWEDLGVGKRMLENAKTKEESRMYKNVEKELVGSDSALSVGNVADILIKGMEKGLSIEEDLNDSESKDKVEIPVNDIKDR